MISIGPPDPSYIGMEGKVLLENLKNKSNTLEENGKIIRIKAIDIIFRRLRIISYLSFLFMRGPILMIFANSHGKSGAYFFREREGISNLWINAKV
jgi:hypothetical protein